MIIKTTMMLPPPILQSINQNLLSIPIYKFDANRIKCYADILLKKLNKNEFNKLIRTKNKLYLKYMYFMELYEQAKTQEKDSKGKTFIKANAPFYRTRLHNRSDQTIFERLDRRG